MNTIQTTDTRRALTVWQPWAHLIVTGQKKVANRAWSTPYRGRLYIHAGAKPVEAAMAKFPTDHPEATRCGGLVGYVDLIGCDRHDTGEAFETPGCWHWRLASPAAIPFEKCRGAQGIWRVGDQKRVVELPEGFTMKTTRDMEGGYFRTTLLRGGIQIAQFENAAHVACQALAAEHALALDKLPNLATLGKADCDCSEHETPNPTTP